MNDGEYLNCFSTLFSILRFHWIYLPLIVIHVGSKTLFGGSEFTGIILWLQDYVQRLKNSVRISARKRDLSFIIAIPAGASGAARVASICCNL